MKKKQVCYRCKELRVPYDRATFPPNRIVYWCKSCWDILFRDGNAVTCYEESEQKIMEKDNNE
jgi:hypothetical protein